MDKPECVATKVTKVTEEVENQARCLNAFKLFYVSSVLYVAKFSCLRATFITPLFALSKKQPAFF